MCVVVNLQDSTICEPNMMIIVNRNVIDSVIIKMSICSSS